MKLKEILQEVGRTSHISNLEHWYNQLANKWDVEPVNTFQSLTEGREAIGRLVAEHNGSSYVDVMSVIGKENEPQKTDANQKLDMELKESDLTSIGIFLLVIAFILGLLAGAEMSAVYPELDKVSNLILWGSIIGAPSVMFIIIGSIKNHIRKSHLIIIARLNEAKTQ